VSWQVWKRKNIVAILAEVGNSFKKCEVRVRISDPGLYISFPNFGFYQ